MRHKLNAGTASAVLIAALAITNLGAQDQPPSVVGVTPSSGSGWAKTFAFQFSDPDGGGSLASAQVDFNASLSAQNACYLYAGFAPEGAYLYLANDAGSWQGPILSGSTGTLQNSQCIRLVRRNRGWTRARVACQVSDRVRVQGRGRYESRTIFSC